MKLTELITRLNAEHAKWGDCEVVIDARVNGFVFPPFFPSNIENTTGPGNWRHPYVVIGAEVKE